MSSEKKTYERVSEREAKLESTRNQRTAMKIIARIHTDFPTKFGLPRQSGIVEELKATIVFEPEYRNPDALRGIEGFSHLWLIWEFSEAVKDTWSPLVRPPRLGGVKRMGVFATRSPFRPNPIGLSCVKLERVVWDTEQGPVLQVRGADLMDQTPIYDIKPYLPFVDSHPEASGGFADPVRDYALEVIFPKEWMDKIPVDRQEALLGVLAHDPRPAYQNDPERIYGFEYCDFDVRFTVREGTLTVCEIVRIR
jgi:tRNA-Thr(GGU) m(6)t(6)A37 methyltransferase TsaA